MKVFAPAIAQFEHLLSLDKYRIDDIDVYSNILYTTENKQKLSLLAQRYLTLDKNRPEVCCMVGKLSVV
jgi:anaphase-promoting complex subunit 8